LRYAATIEEGFDGRRREAVMANAVGMRASLKRLLGVHLSKDGFDAVHKYLKHLGREHRVTVHDFVLRLIREDMRKNGYPVHPDLEL
jgi:hypothetical protein